MADRTAPVQGHAPIPWSVHEAAWAVYAERFGRYQSPERIAERGGFGVRELDIFHPTWRDESEEIPLLRKRIAEQGERIAELEALVAELADDLEAEVRNTHAAFESGEVHPAVRHRFERDMEPVERARKALGGSDA